MKRPLPRSYRRLLIFLLSLPVVLILLAVIYQVGMATLEGEPRTFGASLEWASETLTTTGYGKDADWSHPFMQGYVIFVQFAGQMMVFLIFPFFLIPFFEERFEAKIPTVIPDLTGQILIYRYDPAVMSLVEELEDAKIPFTIFEEDEHVARRLLERGRQVVLGNLREEDPDLQNLVPALGLVVNGEDHDNASMTLSARYHGFQGPIVALMDDPRRRAPMLHAGATAAFTPDHILAAALAARASVRISPRVAGIRHLGRHLEVVEVRIHEESPLAGRTIATSRIRQDTGASIVGLWVGGDLVRQPSPTTPLKTGTIVVAVGSQASIERLGNLSRPVQRTGPILVVGHGSVGRKVVEFLREAGETVRVLHPEPMAGVDVHGDPIDQTVLKRAGVHEAQSIVLTLDQDSRTIFTAAVLRNLVPEAIMIAGTSRAENVSRIHRAGADFALSVGQVAGQLLVYQLLRQESVSLEREIKLVATAVGSFVGRPLANHRILERTGCSIVAVERGEEIIVEIKDEFVLQEGDVVYVSGTKQTLQRYFQAFPDTKVSPVPREPTPVIDGPAENPGIDH